MTKKELKHELRVTKILLQAQINNVSGLTQLSLDLKQKLNETETKLKKAIQFNADTKLTHS